MNLLRWGTNLLENATPAGILLGGAALAVSLPVVRKGLRCAAVLVARGVYSVVDEAKKLTAANVEAGGVKS